jgi:hypothetical protein
MNAPQPALPITPAYPPMPKPPPTTPTYDMAIYCDAQKGIVTSNKYGGSALSISKVFTQRGTSFSVSRTDWNAVGFRMAECMRDGRTCNICRPTEDCSHSGWPENGSVVIASFWSPLFWRFSPTALAPPQRVAAAVPKASQKLTESDHRPNRRTQLARPSGPMPWQEANP